MFKDVFGGFRDAFSLLFKDKIILILSFIPILIGVILFYYLGLWMMNTGMATGEGIIQKYSEGGSVILSWIIKITLYVILYFLINWAFVLIVSILASPFNDAISSRVEKRIKGEELKNIGQVFSGLFSGMIKTIFIEAKKITFILIIFIFSLALQLIPILVPLGLILAAMLVAIQFIDYSWSRHNLDMGVCFKDLTDNFIPYCMAGFFFMGLMAIPIVNLFSLSYGVVYFTALWAKRQGVAIEPPSEPDFEAPGPPLA